MAKNVLSGLALIDANIASIVKRGSALRKDCHSTLILIVEHAIKTGDYTRLPKLAKAVKGALGGSMSAAIVQWTETYTSFLRYDKENSTGGEIAFMLIKGTEKLILPLPKAVQSRTLTSATDTSKKHIYPVGMDARELPFWEVERDVPQEPVDFGKQFHDMIVRTVKALQAQNEPGFTGRKLVGIDATKAERLVSLGVELGYVKADEITVPKNAANDMGPNGQDLAQEAEIVKAKDAPKPRRGRKSTENEPVAVAA